MNRCFRVNLSGTALALTLFLTWGTAYSHGDTPHADNRGADLTPVQTPFGRTGDPKRITRTVQIDMLDTMRFVPDTITVRQGDTLRLMVRNRGQVLHELVIGTDQDLARHAEWMKKNPDMEHEAPYMAHVASGKRGEILWQFTQAGEFRFACLIPGHFDAGMAGRITVLPR